MQFDNDSWAWTVSLSLHSAASMALLEPINGEPSQVRIEIDGIYIHAIIEAWGESRQFGSTPYHASGRSTVALLAQSFARTRSYVQDAQKTAAQLIDYELINSGWSAVYHPSLLQLFTTDWLVGAGAWSYQAKANIDAIVQIASSAGARAYSDRTANIVHIDPRYPVSPWDWASTQPDKTIPINLVRSINTSLDPKPAYNQVYVSGLHQGVLVSAVRQGTAGDNTAPMVAEQLITHVTVGRERARNVLSDAGKQSRVRLELPLTANTELLEPGQLVEILDGIAWRGLAWCHLLKCMLLELLAKLSKLKSIYERLSTVSGFDPQATPNNCYCAT